MLATLVDEAFDDDEWIFELKWDGYRAIAEWQHRELKFYSRNGLSFSNKYTVIAEALKKIKRDVILDGEVVLMDNKGQPDFQKLQQYEDNKHLPLIYYVFDLISLDGKNVQNMPLIQRKKLLKSVLRNTDPAIRYCDHIEKHGIKFFEKVASTNIEGIIAKKRDSLYTFGVRTKEWLKIKHHHSREAIIAGYTAPKGNREHFGALVLAEFNTNSLRYIGHTGTGFNHQALKELWQQMQALITTTSPFPSKIKVNSPVTWLRPELVCQVNYAEETEGGMLRHPVYLGLRIDKKSTEVKKENETPIKLPAKKRKEAGKQDNDKSIVIEKRELSLTNLNKIYWPDEKITKGELIAYYDTIAPFILPYLKDRPLSLKRNPNGITDPGFFHKDAGEAAPEWVKKADIYSESNDKVIHYLVCNEKASLIYIANLGCIEINPWNSTVKKLDKPNYLVIDLDPSDKNSFDEVIDAAKAVKMILDKAGASSYCKTSGASGLHIYIPMGGKYTYAQVKDFGKLIAIKVQQALPGTTSIERSLKKRGDKIYIDVLQNRKGQTLASAYSVRPKPGATVSAPLDWKEVKHGLSPSMFDIYNMPNRLKKKGDLFEPVLKAGIDLKACMKKLTAD